MTAPQLNLTTPDQVSTFARTSQLTRAQAIDLAVRLGRVWWISDARRDGSMRSLVLGRFIVPDPISGLAWPAILVAFQRPAVAGVLPEKILTIACVAVPGRGDPLFGWTSIERRSVPWAQYIGDPHGAPSVLNGDVPPLVEQVKQHPGALSEALAGELARLPRLDRRAQPSTP